MSNKKKALLLGALFFSGNLFAADLHLQNKARNAIRHLESSDLVHVTTSYNYTNDIFVKYTENTKDYFGRINRTSNFTGTGNQGKYLRFGRNADGSYHDQCVSFARAMANYHKPKFVAGRKVTKNMVLKAPAVIFYSEDGKTYKNNSHMAIALENTPQGLKVIDQNWYNQAGYPGIVAVHYLKFSGSYVNNASNYYVAKR